MQSLIICNKIVMLLLLHSPITFTWTDYQTVNILTYTRMRGNGSIDQGVVVLVNDATFAYFDKVNKTFVLRLSASKAFSVLEDNDQSFWMTEVLRGFYRQEGYLHKLNEQIGAARPPLVRPSVNVYNQFPVAEGHANILYCYVTGFYPGDIEISFFLNGCPVTLEGGTSDLTYGEDWNFRVYKYIHIMPQPGEEYTCQVKHSSMAKPKVSMWRPDFPQSDPNSYWGFALASGIMCGIIVSGLIVRKRGTA